MIQPVHPIDIAFAIEAAEESYYPESSPYPTRERHIGEYLMRRFELVRKPALPKVGDEVTTWEESDRLPDRALLIHSGCDGQTAIQWFTDEHHDAGSGWGTADGSWRIDIQEYLPATIVWLPDENQAVSS